MVDAEQVQVWDLPIRLFHWSLVALALLAFVTGELHAGLHVWIGYALCVLLALRLYLGLRGSRYARFSSFLFTPRETFAYLRTMFHGKPAHYLGHNPAGALMVFALLGLLAMLLVSGLTTLGMIDFEGPLLVLANRVSDDTAYALRHLHELLALVAAGAVGLHVAGVAVGSVQHRENLVKAMITGRKRVSPEA